MATNKIFNLKKIYILIVSLSKITTFIPAFLNLKQIITAKKAKSESASVIKPIPYNKGAIEDKKLK